MLRLQIRLDRRLPVIADGPEGGVVSGWGRSGIVVAAYWRYLIKVTRRGRRRQAANRRLAVLPPHWRARNRCNANLRKMFQCLDGRRATGLRRFGARRCKG